VVHSGCPRHGPGLARDGRLCCLRHRVGRGLCSGVLPGALASPVDSSVPSAGSGGLVGLWCAPPTRAALPGRYGFSWTVSPPTPPVVSSGFFTSTAPCTLGVFGMSAPKVEPVKPLVAAKSSKPNWEPKTKAEERMDKAFRNLSRSERMDRAVGAVLEGDLSVSAAARKFGVDRSACSRKVSGERKRREEQDERSARARAENVAAVVDEPVREMLPDGPISESRRVGSFREFNDRYFSNEMCPDCDKHHDTPDFHLEVMDLLEDRSKRLKLVNFAPYHAKSTICTFKSTLYELVRDPKSRTAIISAGGDLAEAMLYQIKEHLTDPDLYDGSVGNLIEDWGPFYNPGHWGKDSIYIYGRSGAQKDPSVSTYGFGKKIYGRRFDRMIFDDVADMENQNTPEAIQKMYRKVWQEYVNRVGKTGQIIFVGTRVMPGDVYSLLDDVEGMNVFRRPCIIDEETGSMLWPDHYPLRSALEQKSAMSVEQFQLVYQNVDTPGFGASFPPDVLERSHDPERFQGHYDPSWVLVLGVDPAGANAQAGYTAMVVLGVDVVSGRRYLVDLVNQKQMKAPQIMDQIFDWSEKYPLRELRVEVNGLQSQIFQYNTELQSRMANRGIRVVPHITHKGNKFDPRFGVEAMSSLYHNGVISTPSQDINSREKFKQLEEQLQTFPMGNVSDLVMAMWFAELGCKEYMQRQTAPSFDPRAKIPSRIANKRRIVNFGDRTTRAPGRQDLTSPLHGAPGSPGEHSFVNVAGLPGVGIN